MLLAAAFQIKLLLYAASLAAIGLALHRIAGIEMPGRASLRAGAAIAAAAVAQFFLTGTQIAGSLKDVLTPDVLSWTWMSAGTPSLALLSGAAALILSAYMRTPLLPLVSAVLISSAFGLSGHAAGLESPGIAPLVVALHVFIAGYWLMAPLSLWPAANIGDADVLERTRRFSRFAAVLVPLLFVSGPFLLWSIAGGIQEIISTVYGRVILAKFTLALAILALGALNMLVVTRRLESSPGAGRAALRKTLSLDAVLFVGILLLIAAATTVATPGEGPIH